jgi:hypothetical protein
VKLTSLWGNIAIVYEVYKATIVNYLSMNLYDLDVFENFSGVSNGFFMAILECIPVLLESTRRHVSSISMSHQIDSE